MSTLYLDLETRSREDLRKTNVYRYSICPDFRILMASYCWDSGPIETLVNHDDILDLLGECDNTTQFVAHNAQFERVCLSRLLYEAEDGVWMPPEQWRDTMALGVTFGLPGSLEQMAKAMRCTPKDASGKDLIKLFCVPRRDGGWNDATTHPMDWYDFMLYCEQDVGTLRELSVKLGAWPNQVEENVWFSDQRINDTGMQVDLKMAAAAEKVSIANAVEMKARVRELTGVDNPGSVQQMGRWAASEGLEMPNWQATTVQAVLDGPGLSERQREVFELRQELALAAASKFSAALISATENDRLRGCFRFFGAHTGRWSGNGVQPQNLPRAHFDTELEEWEAIENLLEGGTASQLELKKLVRSLFVGPFTVVDYGSIEARVIAWLAGEQWALDAFVAGRDIYVETAKRMGPKMTRAQGKVAVLALGYQGGVNSFKSMAGDMEMNDRDIKNQIVLPWRRANPNIVKLWAALQDAIESGGRAGRIRVSRHGGSMRLHLPSGRAIHYHKVHWRKQVIDGKVRDGWVYADPKKPGLFISTYGGRLAENVTQAVARDLLAAGLVRLHEAGYTVVGHVHDEVIVEGEHDPEVIAKIMCESLEWTAGLPLAAEGFQCNRYRKG